MYKRTRSPVPAPSVTARLSLFININHIDKMKFSVATILGVASLVVASPVADVRATLIGILPASANTTPTGQAPYSLQLHH